MNIDDEWECPEMTEAELAKEQEAQALTPRVDAGWERFKAQNISPEPCAVSYTFGWWDGYEAAKREMV